VLAEAPCAVAALCDSANGRGTVILRGWPMKIGDGGYKQTSIGCMSVCSGDDGLSKRRVHRNRYFSVCERLIYP